MSLCCTRLGWGCISRGQARAGHPATTSSLGHPAAQVGWHHELHRDPVRGLVVALLLLVDAPCVGHLVISTLSFSCSLCVIRRREARRAGHGAPPALGPRNLVTTSRVVNPEKEKLMATIDRIISGDADGDPERRGSRRCVSCCTCSLTLTLTRTHSSLPVTHLLHGHLCATAPAFKTTSTRS